MTKDKQLRAQGLMTDNNSDSIGVVSWATPSGQPALAFGQACFTSWRLRRFDQAQERVA